MRILKAIIVFYVCVLLVSHGVPLMGFPLVLR